jgi:hypothetical protein
VAADLYEAVPPQISQGDILRRVPHAYLPHPLTKLRSLGENKYEAEPEPFSEFNEKQGELVAANCKRRIALLLTPDCEIDKDNRRWLVCPIKPLADLSGKFQDSIKRNRVVSALFLPGHLELFPDGYADFNQITTLEPAVVRQAERVVSLSDIGRIALYKQYVRWFTRWTLQDITCPNCFTSFDPTITLKVRNP